MARGDNWQEEQSKRNRANKKKWAKLKKKQIKYGKKLFNQCDYTELEVLAMADYLYNELEKPNEEELI